ncbi:diacylglycerol/lipid kinase family protein [Candidatus Galacturonibacter soehngenii]|nr:diacylglycerol kinase family protein [Candidatus Galacturonibacter soehngenii]MBA4687137.1 diacylglycerol kinase family lipid kinase [Candidatus Galacturonibacter soehngenii]
MLYFIVNLHSKSGYAKVIWKQVKKELKKENINYKVFFTEYKGHATWLAKELTSNHQKLRLVVLGGDGTVNEVVGGILNFKNVTLGYIPTGSSNDLARSLRLPSSPKEAIFNILNPKYFVHLDIGEVKAKNKARRFIVSSGMGFDAAICQEALDSQLKKTLNKLKLGKLTYVVLALKQIIMFQTVNVEVTIDETYKRNYKRIYFISSHIHKYEGGGLMLCPNASYQDGKIDVCVVKNISKVKLLFFLPTAYFGKHTRFQAVDMMRCKKLRLKASKKLHVHTDGEIFGIQDEVLVHTLNEKLTMITGNIF